MGHVAHIGEKRKAYRFLMGKNLKERDCLEDLSIDEITKKKKIDLKNRMPGMDCNSVTAFTIQEEMHHSFQGTL